MRVVKSLITHCLGLLAELADARAGMRVTDLAAALDEPKSSVQRLLGQLAAEGWVEQDGETGHYRLTLRLATLGQRHLQAIGITDASSAILDQLARQTRELVRLTIVDGTRLVWIGSAQGAPPGLMYEPGMGHQIVSFATANGKAWLSTLTAEEALRIANSDGLGRSAPRPGIGPRVMKSGDAVLADLAQIRQRRYALALEEAEPGVNAVAIAIVEPSTSTTMGTVSVAGPSVRMAPRKLAEFAEILHSAAGDLVALWPAKAATGATVARPAS